MNINVFGSVFSHLILTLLSDDVVFGSIKESFTSFLICEVSNSDGALPVVDWLLDLSRRRRRLLYTTFQALVVKDLLKSFVVSFDVFFYLKFMEFVPLLLLLGELIGDVARRTLLHTSRFRDRIGGT